MADVAALAHEVGALQLDAININYADNKTASVNQVDMLRRLLAGEEECGVVVFGDRNFTFSMALAGRRQSWDGITSTCHENMEHQFSDVKLMTVDYCVKNGERLRDADGNILSRIKPVLNLPIPPNGTWRFGVDATCIPEDLNVQQKVVWFQCPWTENYRTVGDLIERFLQHMPNRPLCGGYVLLGIVNKFPYTKSYLLQNLLGPELAGNPPGYRFLGADKVFVKELLQYGYRHEGNRDIHDDIFEHHITLVFQKL